MEMYVHNEVKSDVEFILKRISEQRKYINEVTRSARKPSRKTRLINSAKFIKDRFVNELGGYYERGLIMYTDPDNDFKMRKFIAKLTA